MKIAVLIFVTILLLLIIGVFRKNEGKLNTNIKILQKINFLPIIEVLIFTIYGLWVINHFFDNSIYKSYITISITIIVLMILSWYLLRDFLKGMIIKSQKYITNGQKIEINNYVGTVEQMGATGFTILTSSGSMVKIPYSNVSQFEIHQQSNKEGNQLFNFQFELSSNLSANDLLEKIKMSLLNTPWIISNKLPGLKIIEQEGDRYIIEVVLDIINPEYGPLIEKEIKSRFC